MSVRERKKRDRVVKSLHSILDLNYPQYDDLVYGKRININNCTHQYSVLRFTRGELNTGYLLSKMVENFLEGRFINVD